MSVKAADDLKITTSIALTENIIGAVSVQNPVSDNWRSVVIKGEYSGSPAHNNTEELPGDASWMATASCDDLDFKDNKKTCDWQTDSELKFFVKSTTPKKYTITISITLRVAIHKKNSDGTKGEFLRNSPEIELSVERDVWIVGIGDVKVKPKDSDDTSYITAPSEVVVLVGASCTFKVMPDPSDAPAWPSDKPAWKHASNSGVGDSGDMRALDIGSSTLTYECGNTKTFTITNLKPTLDSVDFKDGGVQTIKDVGTEPEWKKANDNGQGGRNEPFCVIKNSTFSMHTKLSLSKRLTFSTPVLIKNSISINVAYDGREVDGKPTDSYKNCEIQNQSFEISLNMSSPQLVGTNTTSHVWYYTINGGTNWVYIEDFSQIAYFTWDKHKLENDQYFTNSTVLSFFNLLCVGYLFFGFWFFCAISRAIFVR